jgi:hypothetical protein
MAWPPPLLSYDRSNSFVQQDLHPQDHNAANLAINDIVARMATVATQKSWVPNWVSGGASVPHSTQMSSYMDLGGMRIGGAIMTATADVAAGGILVGSGFWGASIYYGGFFDYYDAGVLVYTGTVKPYDATSACFQVSGNTSVFGITPPMAPGAGDQFRLFVIAYI